MNRSIESAVRRRVAIDVDGVLADQVTHVLARARKDYGVRMSKNDITAWDTKVDSIPFDKLILRYFKKSKFVATMPIMKGSIGAIRLLRQKARIIVVTNRPIGTKRETFRWLARNFKIKSSEFHDYARSPGKATLDADVLIDDRIRNIKSFTRPHSNRYGILFDQPWNRDKHDRRGCTMAKKIIIARNWSQVVVLFEKIDELLSKSRNR